MKWFLVFWCGPIAFIGSWYGLSYYDISFGTFFFSRQMHDLVFEIYGQVLGVPAAEVPRLVLDAILLDSAIVLGLLALRRHRELRAWWRRRRGQEGQPDDLEMTDSLSNAP